MLAYFINLMERKRDALLIDMGSQGVGEGIFDYRPSQANELEEAIEILRNAGYTSDPSIYGR